MKTMFGLSAAWIVNTAPSKPSAVESNFIVSGDVAGICQVTRDSHSKDRSTRKIHLLCGASRAYLGFVNRIWTLGSLIIAFLLGNLPSATAASRPVENRYLFILETSKEMKREEKVAKNVL